MSDPNTALSESGKLIPLPEALRALPLAVPPEGGWSLLAASLAKSAPVRGIAAGRRRRRYVLPVALAAAIVAGFIATLSLRLPRRTDATANVAASAPATKLPDAASSVHNVAKDANASDEEGLAAAQTRSHALERWLRDTGKDSTPQSAPDVAASAEIEDMIGIVDMQLADQPDGSASLPLWHRRVALLEDLATLRYGANLDQFDKALLASETGALRRATWNN
jgi:hypothetical protein